MAIIEQQIAEFHKLKNECVEDMEDFMDEIENKRGEDGSKLIQIPEDFDEVVSLHNEEMTLAQEANFEEDSIDDPLDEDGNPMWQKFVRVDYYQQNSEPTNPKLKAIMADPKQKKEYQKIQRELQKIRSLDQELASTTKVY